MAVDRRTMASKDSALQVDTVYEGMTSNIGDEPINTMLGCGNMGGFRIRGRMTPGGVALVALFTTFADDDWPDRFDSRLGRFTYFGDNKSPGRDLHDTVKGGNRLLRWTFSAIHVADHQRGSIPPFFVFAKKDGNRAAKFLGVAAPGAADCPESEDLVATWTALGNDRFQNYRATFTILDIPVASRAWIHELEAGKRDGPNAPGVWREWIATGTYQPRT